MLDEAPPATAQPEVDPSPRRSRRRAWAGALASYLLMVIGLLVLNFLLPRAMPGDPIDGLLATGSSGFTLGEEARAELEEYYGLDKPLPAQFVHYVARLAHGDFGRSVVTNMPVRGEIGRGLPWSLLLIVGSVGLATTIGLLAGVHAGWRRDRPVDRSLMAGLLAVREFPPYLLGSLLLYVFAVKLGWFELSGAETPFTDYGIGRRILDIAWHATLPIVVLTAGLVAGAYLMMRAGMVRELGSDYLQLGRAKGLRPRRLKYHYAARNALLPVVSLTAVEVGFAFNMTVLVERVFSYPGVGRLMFDSIGARDYPTIQGTFLVVSLAIVTANALADVLYRRLDPRTTA